MSKLEKRMLALDEKMEELNQNVVALQDVLLHIKATLELVTRTEVEKQCLASLTLKTNENMDKFLGERPSKCSSIDWCTRRVERATSMILRAFMEQGTRPAIEQAKYHVEASIRHSKEIKCPDDKCLRNAINVFKTLEELIGKTQERSGSFTRNLYSPKRLSGSNEIREEEVSELLAPLSNATRLKILNTLGKGGKSYAQLEHQMGIRGGHLQFHLTNLLQVGFITQEKRKGEYSITMKGLRALRSSYELREATLTMS